MDQTVRVCWEVEVYFEFEKDLLGSNHYQVSFVVNPCQFPLANIFLTFIRWDSNIHKMGFLQPSIMLRVDEIPDKV